jgi:hypothetical protein
VIEKIGREPSIDRRQSMKDLLKKELVRLDPYNTLRLFDVDPQNALPIMEAKITQLKKGNRQILMVNIKTLERSIEECAALQVDIEKARTRMTKILKETQLRGLLPAYSQQKIIDEYLQSSGTITQLRGYVKTHDEIWHANGLVDMMNKIWRAALTGFTDYELPIMIKQEEERLEQIKSRMKDVFDNVMEDKDIIVLRDMDGEIIKTTESLVKELSESADLTDLVNISTEHLITITTTIEQQIESTLQFMLQQQIPDSRGKIAKYRRDIDINDELIKMYTAYKDILTNTGTTPRGA